MGGASLDLDAVRAAASKCAFVGVKYAVIEYHDSIGSTNDRAAVLAAEGVPEGSIVVAGAQEEGRGRLGKSWSSPTGGLYLSIVLRPDQAMLRRLPVTLLGGLAVAEAIDACTDLEAQLKWPNDVYVGGKKVAGILGELSRDEGVQRLVLGIGVNVGAVDLPEELSDTATSLAAHGEAPPLNEFLSQLLIRFEDHYTSVQRGGGVGILTSASARMPMLGTAVRINLPDRSLTGIASGLNQTGGLILELEDGTRDVFVAGEVEEVRPK